MSKSQKIQNFNKSALTSVATKFDKKVRKCAGGKGLNSTKTGVVLRIWLKRALAQFSNIMFVCFHQSLITIFNQIGCNVNNYYCKRQNPKK